MDTYTIALFGEAEKGEFRTAYYCRELSHLDEFFGNPPPESRGLFYAVQALMYNHPLVFFRVAQEGFGKEDYLWGLRELEKTDIQKQITAVCVPGVADEEIMRAIAPICAIHHAIIISNESDLYDYLTEKGH